MGLTPEGNTYNPCLLILRCKRYELSVEQRGDQLLWNARKEGSSFTAGSPPELLGIVVLWETWGYAWNRQWPDVLGEVTARVPE